MKCSLLVLSCYLDAELEPARRGELEAHLVGCPRCRAGLSHLREEVERVGALAQVHVPDHSVHALFEQIGLIGPDDPLPPRAAGDFSPTVVDAPPWLSAAPASALPWTPPPKRHHVHTEAAVAGGDDAGLAAAAHDVADVELNGTAHHHPAPVPAEPEAQPDPDEESGVPSLPLPPPAGAPTAVTPWSPQAALAGPPALSPPPAPPSPPVPTVEVAGAVEPLHDEAAAGTEAEVEVELESGAAAPLTDHLAAEPDMLSEPEVHGEADVLAEPEAIGASDVLAEPDAPVTGGIAEAGPPLEPPAVPPPPPAAPEHSLRRDRLVLGLPSDLPPPPPSAAGAAAAGDREAEASSTHGDTPEAVADDLLATAVAPFADPTDITAAGSDTGEQPGTPASDGGDIAVAVRNPDTQALYPMTDDDVLDDDVLDDDITSGPTPAPRVGLIERLRDRFALHRAISRTPGQDLEDGVEILSGAGAPIRGGGRSRAELARRRSEALRPSALPGEPPESPSVPDYPRPLLDRLAERSAAAASPPPAGPIPSGRPGPDPRSFPSVEPPSPEPRDEPFGIAQRGLFDPFSPESDADAIPDRLPPAAYEPPPAMPEHARRPPWRPRSDVEVAGEVGGTVVTRPRVPAEAASPSEAREGRRLLVLFGAAVIVMFAVGLASARSTSPLPVAGPATTTPPQATARAAPSAAPSARASTAPSAPAATSGAPTTLQLTGITTLGDGGTGWQVQGIRYGTHTGYFRVVLDFGPAAGSASGTPKTTIGFEDPTTLDIIIDGVVPAGGTGSLPNTATITSVTLVTPSPKPGSVVYRLKLAHAVSPAAVFATSPLRLILDLH